jgi:catechol 2,3-dioxygenase-like lactoylglutathione lyase family enzyme
MSELSKGARRNGIADVGAVGVPVSDQERAVRFYVDRLGFEVRLDVPLGDGARWVQVAPPGGRVAIALVRAEGGAVVGVDTGITFATASAETDHASFVWRGVDADEVLHWPGVPAMFSFRDQDGNQLKVMETASEGRD